MKRCPKCKELNGENSTFCFKCKTTFPASGRVDNYKKKCRKCGAIYNSGAVICDQCGGGLSVVTSNSAYDQSYSSNSSGTSNVWMYVVSVLIPLLGIILGCIKIGKDENELGKSLIITGIVANILGVFGYYLLFWILLKAY